MKMDKDNLERLLIDYLDGVLTKADEKIVEEQLTINPEARRMFDQLNILFGTIASAPEPAPSPELSRRFHEMLEIENDRMGRSVTMRPWIYRMAAAVALVVTGVGIGYWISMQQDTNDELLAVQQPVTKEQVLDQLRNELSPSQRIQGVLAGSQQAETDPDIVDALVNVMNSDPNSNVRLAAVEALATFSEEQKVRNALVNALATQTDPVVQLALIRLMVDLKETEAIEHLKKLSEDESALPAVQDEAHAGIIRLS